MNSFLFEKEQIHCNCFDNSPKNAPRIFRIDSTHSSKNSNKQTKENSGRNVSEQAKHKKKSLKKERQLSNYGSEKDNKQKEQITHHIFIPDVPNTFTSNQLKKQQKIIGFEHFEHSTFLPAKSQRNKPLHNWRTQRPQAFYQPIDLQMNSKKAYHLPMTIHSQKIIIDTQEYDKKINEEFEKDFNQFKLNMQRVQSQKQEQIVSHKKRKQTFTGHKLALQNVQYVQPPLQIRYPATEHVIPIQENLKSPHRVASFKSSAVSNRQKISIKKEKNKIFPKQIQSEKDSQSQTESDKLSEVVGRGWDGMTEKRFSLYEMQFSGKPQKARMQTMATQQSHIQTSQINTFTEFSNILTSPKSLYNKGMAFGGAQKYGMAGMSYQHIDEIKRPQMSSHKNIN